MNRPEGKTCLDVAAGGSGSGGRTVLAVGSGAIAVVDGGWTNV